MGGLGRSGKKRKHEKDEENEVNIEEIGVNEDDLDNEEDEGGRASARGRGDDPQSRKRRTETFGRKKVEKEVFRKGMQRKRQRGSLQWSR